LQFIQSACCVIQETIFSVIEVYLDR